MLNGLVTNKYGIGFFGVYVLRLLQFLDIFCYNTTFNMVCITFIGALVSRLLFVARDGSSHKLWLLW